MSALLSLNLKAQATELERSILHSVPLDPHSDDPSLYVLRIPGIREDSPKLAIDGRMLVRGLFSVHRMASSEAIEVEVVGSIKAQGLVYVRAPDLAAVDAVLPKVKTTGEDGHPRLSALYQVRFKASAAPVCAMQDAVSGTCSLLSEMGKPVANPIS